MKISNTNWNLYKSFTVVYETRNFSRTAKLLNISRQAVSKNIKELSDQIGVALFTPNYKGVEPTLYATNIYPKIKKAVDFIVESEQSLNTFDSDSTGVLKMVVQISIAEHKIMEYMKEFHAKYPKVTIEFLRQTLEESQEKSDFIITLDDVIDKSKFKTVNLFSHDGIFVASKDFLKKHGLSQSLSVNDLLKLPIIERYEILEYLNRQIDTKPYKVVFIKSSSAESTISMTKRGLGIGSINKEMFDILKDSNLVQLNIKDFSLESSKVVCAYTSLSPIARIFIDGFIKFCKQ